jgi:hypothetical protein
MPESFDPPKGAVKFSHWRENESPKDFLNP